MNGRCIIAILVAFAAIVVVVSILILIYVRNEGQTDNNITYTRVET